VNTRKPLWLLAIAYCLFQGQMAAGHVLDASNLFLNFENDRIHGRIEVAVRDINTALGLDLPTGAAASLDDVMPHIAELQRYLDQHVDLHIAGRSGPLPFTDVGMLKVTVASFVQLNFSYDGLDEDISKIDVDYSVLFDRAPNHRGLLVIENNWKTGTFNNEANVSLIFEPGRERQTLDLSDSSTWRGFAAMVRLGTHHIWIGLDHILFLLALLLPSVVQRGAGNRWEPVAKFSTALIHVIKVVTVFTVAHTITLSLAALNAMTLPSRLVESVIAISIAAAALNIFVPIFRDRIWLVVFAFGLFHGFGFASVLREMGIPSSYMVHSLLGFNIGVELGQVAIVIGLFPVLYLLGRSIYYSRLLLPAMTAGLIAVSLYWFTERAFLIDLPAGEILHNIIAWVV